MIAVIQTGGKQYVVTENQQFKIEKLEVEPGQSVTFDDVLLIADAEGNVVEVGTPTVKGKTVVAEVLAQGRDRKIRVVKYKNKTRYHKVYGHRQHFTKVRVTSIAGSVFVKPAKKEVVAEVKKAPKKAAAK